MFINVGNAYIFLKVSNGACVSSILSIQFINNIGNYIDFVSTIYFNFSVATFLTMFLSF